MKKTAISLCFLVACGNAPADIDPCDVSGNICTWAGVPQIQRVGLEGVKATRSELNLPQDVSFGPDGSAYIPDFNNHRIRRVDPKGVIATISGTGFLGDGPQGSSTVFAWNHPTNIAVDPDNPSILHVAGWHNSRINRIDMSSNNSVFSCGTGGRDYAGDGDDALDAVLDLPSSIAFDDAGNLYISDQANQAIRRVRPDNTIELIAGSPGVELAGAWNSDPTLPVEDHIEDATAGYEGDGGPAIDALLFAEIGQQADPSSKLTVSDGMLYLADSGNNVIRTIDLDTMIIDRIAGVPWHRDGIDLPAASDPTAGDGGDALEAYLNNPRDVAVGIDGEVYIADTDNHCVRVVYANGEIDTFAGTCGAEPQPGDAFVGEAEPAVDARLHAPYGVATDSDGNVYIADTKNQVIRRVAY